MKLLTRLIQSVLILIPVGILVWLVQQQFVPSGVFVVKHSIEDTSPFIERLLPDARVRPLVQQGQEWIQEIVGDPVFFFVHPQRAFDRATFEVWFNNTDVPIVEFGGLARTNPEAYDLQPMQNLLIDQSTWPRLEEQGTILLQRHPTYDSLQAFVTNPPAADRVAVYHTDRLPSFRLPDYQATPDERTLVVSLRGHHEFKTYVKDEVLSVRFEYMDMNRDEGADPVILTVFDEQGRPVGSARGDDDGDVSALARPSGMRSVELSVPGLSEGVYKLVFDVSRDVFIRKIKTPQQRLVALNTVYLADEVAYREPAQVAALFTTAKRIQAQTRHADGVQTVHVGEQTLAIEQPYTLYTLDDHRASRNLESFAHGLTDVRPERGDVELILDQPAAFAPEMFFNPEPTRLHFYTDLDQDGIDYIIADYTSPERRGDWFVAKMDVDLSKLRFETKYPELRFFRDGNWKFVFSSPGIQDLQAHLDIKAINITFQGRAIGWKELIQAFHP